VSLLELDFGEEKRPALTAQQMRAALYRHYVGQYAVLFEVSSDARQEDGSNGKIRSRAIDVLLVRRARRRNIGELETLAIEIKVSRGDFLADVKNPAKQAGWREIASRHAYAAPAGLVRPDEIPAGSGLLAVKQFGGVHLVEWAKRVPFSGLRTVPAWLTLTLAYRMSEAEAKVRGLSSDIRRAGESAEDLRAALAKAQADNERISRQHDRVLLEAQSWRAAFAAVGGVVPCRHCGQPVKPRSLRGGYFSMWRHASGEHDAPCELGRPRYSEVEPADDPGDDMEATAS
jgi:hypothetical protein